MKPIRRCALIIEYWNKLILLNIWDIGQETPNYQESSSNQQKF
jgi:hypothetical protein